MYFCQQRVNGSSGGRLLHYTDGGSSWHVGRRWGRLSVGWLGIVASPATLLAPGNSAESRMGNRGCTWTTPLWFRQLASRVIWEQLAATYHLPAACHVTPTLSTPSVHPQHTHVTHITPTLSTPLKPHLSSPVWPHALLYKNPFPQFDEREGWNSGHTSIQI